MSSLDEFCGKMLEGILVRPGVALGPEALRTEEGTCIPPCTGGEGGLPRGC